ncbi:hypothetical protein DO97_20240 [Neosynechococcus sphagnicola sy1]|uniref:Uncharacterized protein n=1 Tax=Neosynechococcus sphagnicola sy1 TaxID=1497020 RepID=A0A098TM68_9CYAN|nr:V-type ATPase 116kDa subunit family protein [Neosynechococcus sphagnicola]KGF73410.1 hypothetical protein DO97_20240 [Neosynechococcus sphagnicola sy1]
MAIGALKRVTILGTEDQKIQVLAELQSLGVMHLIDLTPENTHPPLPDPFKDTRLAVRYLEDCPQSQRPARHLGHFNPQQQVERILKLKADSEALMDERDRLVGQISQLKVWGKFHLPNPEALGGLQFFFYQLNLRQFRQLAKTEYAYKVVRQDSRYRYVVVIHPELPSLPFPALQLPDRSLGQLQERLEDVDDSLENLETRRIGATRFANALRDYLTDALNATELLEATHHTYDEAGLFALQGWCPVHRLSEVMALGEKLGFAIETTTPSPDDSPPTYLENRSGFAAGESLIQIYGMPAYGGWDPSAMVFVSFVLFFGLILADAGYGLVLTAIALFLRPRLLQSGQRQLWLLMVALAASSTIYGLLAGEYFGIEAAKGSWLDHIAIFKPDLDKLSELMAFSIGIGALHVSIANAISVYQKWGRPAVGVHLGWILVVVGGYGAWLFRFLLPEAQLAMVGSWALGVGLVSVFCFTHPGPLTPKGILHWLLGGLHGLTDISKIFGDVLSYLRLFALGLSSTYLAVTFNQLAGDMAKTGEIGMLIAFLILLLGHTMNFVLCLMAGTIHGLRLNFIEFYRWSQDPEAEGHPFKPLKKYLFGNVR